MAETHAPIDRITALVDEAFADLANPEVRLSDVIAKAIRIARLRNDFDNLHWLEMELRPLGDERARWALAAEFGGHYTANELERRNKEVVENYIAERTSKFPMDTMGEKTKEQVLAVSVREIEQKIDAVEAFAKGPEIPSGMHTLDVHAAYEERKNAMAAAANANYAIRAVLTRIEHRVREFLSTTEKQLLYGQLNADIFERNRQYVDELLATVAPDAFAQITSAYRRAQEGDDEARSQALLSCRRALKSVADVLYPATEGSVTDAEGGEHQLTDDKWRNRLVQFVKERLAAHPAGDLLETQIDDLARRFRGLGQAGDRGVHAQVTAFELNQAVIQTYLTVGDLLRLHADDSGLVAVAQGLAVES
jgi:hypothetical protein